MFIVVFVVMLPVQLRTGDPVQAWRAGLAWAFIIGVIVLFGALVGPWILRWTPRAAMLGSLAGISITFIAMRPAAQMWQAPWIGARRVRVHPRRLARFPADAVRTRRSACSRSASRPRSAWIAVLAGWSDILEPSAVSESLGQLALHLPIPGGEVLHGLRDIAPLLATAVPLGVYNFAEGMSNVESAAAAGDRYPVRQVLAADGIGAIVGSFLGSPFPPAVYIGHPGWKQVGGRIGYSLVTGIVVAVVCFTGLVGTFLAIFPMQALVPVLLYIGLVIGSQASTTSARRYAPAIVLAMLPEPRAVGHRPDRQRARRGRHHRRHAWGRTQLIASGVIYDGLQLFGQGAVLVGILLGAIACFVIDRRYYAAAVTSVIAAALSFVGLVNAEAVTWNAAPGGHPRLPAAGRDPRRVRLRRARGEVAASSTTGCCSSTAP